MIFTSSPRLVSVAPRLRYAILVLAALFVSHDAIYVARFGVGDGYAEAMSARGHDAYWAPASLLIAIGVGLVALTTIAAYRRIRHDALLVADATVVGPSYLAELSGVWLRLFPIVAVLFGVQENLEHLAVDGHLTGLAPLIGAGSGHTLPVLAVTTFLLATIGAAFRWRMEALEARLATARRRFARVRAATRPGAWDTVAAAIAHRWIIDRLDAGRAPPRDLQAITIPTA
jgi:hypothetical protein